jgi:ribosomal protein L18E
VTQHGFFKVLGKGHLPENKPFVVKAKLISKTAEKKIKEAGVYTTQHYSLLSLSASILSSKETINQI